MLIDDLRKKVNEVLYAWYPPGGPSDLHRACHYAIEERGRRAWRPLLLLAAAMDLGMPVEKVLEVAAAYEALHCASLLMNDLPCMDDGKTRRGKPCCHIAYGEATTLLAFTELVVHAVTVITRFEVESLGRSEPRIRELCSTAKILWGQFVDLNPDAAPLSWAERAYLKNGAFFENIMQLVEECALLHGRKAEGLGKWGALIGRWHQAMDDLYDHCGDMSKGGKETHVDEAKRGGGNDASDFIQMIRETERKIISSAPGGSSREILDALLEDKKSIIPKDVLPE